MPILRMAMPYQGKRELELALSLLTTVNVWQMRNMRAQVPPLYASRISRLDRHDVHYQREERGHEEWLTAVLVAKQGAGDCEDLACYRAAELIVSGETAARAIPMRTRAGWHIVVRRADKSIEDPSSRLGMNAGARKSAP